MNLMDTSICRLCLQVCTSDFEVLESSLLTILNFLVLNLDLGISDGPVVCTTCIGNLRKCFSFKEDRLHNTYTAFSVQEDHTPNIVKVCARGTVNATDTASDACYFCMKSINHSSVVFFKNNVDLVVTLERHFPEVGFNISENSQVCMPCYTSLQHYTSVVRHILNVEEKIREFCKIEERNNKGQVELSEVLHFTSKNALGDEGTLCQLAVTRLEKEQHCREIKNEGIEVKSEDFAEIVQHDLDTSKADMAIKIEQNDWDSLRFPQDLPEEAKAKLVTTDKQISAKKLETYSYQSNSKSDHQKHLPSYKNGSEVMMYKCKICPFQNKDKKNLRRHVLTHENSTSEIMYKCNVCTYQTRYKHALPRHMLTHKTTSEENMFKCEKCIYQSIRKRDLLNHMLTHKSASEVTMYKCELCSHQSKYKHQLSRHILIHKSELEVTMYKCEMCTFRTKYRSCLSEHMLTHKSTSELKMFQCGMCKYQTKYKSVLSTHVLTHKSTSEVTMYKCEICAFQTKIKCGLKRHMIVHKNTSEVTVYKCEICMHQTRYKSALLRHAKSQRHLEGIHLKKCI